MIRRLRAWVADSPVRGGIAFLGVVLAIALLFVAGTLVGSVVMSRTDDEQSSGREDHPRAESPNGAGERGEDATLSPGGEMLSRVPAEGVVGSAGGATAGASDAARAAKPPSALTGDRVELGAEDYLDAKFGPTLAPTVQGFTPRGGAVAKADSVTAVYTGADSTATDLLRLIVVELNDDKAAAAWVEGRTAEFPSAPLRYDWGGRRILQSMTAEDRPEEFPPSISLAWAQGRFAVQITTIPIEVSRVTQARDSALVFVAALPY